MAVHVEYEVSIGEATQRYTLDTEEGNAEDAVSAFSHLIAGVATAMQSQRPQVPDMSIGTPQH